MVSRMSTPTKNPARIFIHRGRPQQKVSGAADYLRLNDKMAMLLPTIQRNLRLKQDCQHILPRMFDSCEVLQLQDDVLTLAAPNAALATKLKQSGTKLQTCLQERGWQVNAIRIKVQVKRVIEKPAPVKQISLSNHALHALTELEQSLEKNKHNTDLHAALARMIARHQNK